MERTPGLWKTETGKSRGYGQWFSITAIDPATHNTSKVLYTPFAPSTADMEFIVRACNAHDDLLEACEAMLIAGAEDAPAHIAHKLARAAIKKAKRDNQDGNPTISE